MVECDGHYMLIDGGDESGGDKVYDVLEGDRINCLDILVVSHFHKDHIAGLSKVLKYASKIKKTICVSDYDASKAFSDFEHQLRIDKSKITVPAAGDKYELGSATVEVVDVGDPIRKSPNDSLVLLITYGNTRFLFTGDIEGAAQTRISDKYQNDADEEFKINLMKIPHHGAYTHELYRFLRTFMPDYAIISVGANNTYGHPKQETLDLLNNKVLHSKVYRTDEVGDIIVKSDGREVSVSPLYP